MTYYLHSYGELITSSLPFHYFMFVQTVSRLYLYKVQTVSRLYLYKVTAQWYTHLCLFDNVLEMKVHFILMTEHC